MVDNSDWRKYISSLKRDEKRKHPDNLSIQTKAYIELILLHLITTPTNHRRETPSTSTQWSRSRRRKVWRLLMSMQLYSLLRLKWG
jgi:hypothetical protein